MNTAISPLTTEVHHVPLAIRLLRRAKPAIVAMLRSSLHALLSRDVLLITWTGRRSGRRFTLPLSYVECGDAIVLCTRGESSTWWKNMKGGADVELVLRGRTVPAKATVLDRASTEALDGLRAFVTHNPRTGVMLYKVAPGPNEADLAREVQNSVVVKLRTAAATSQAAVAAR